MVNVLGRRNIVLLEINFTAKALMKFLQRGFAFDKACSFA